MLSYKCIWNLGDTLNSSLIKKSIDYTDKQKDDDAIFAAACIYK